MWRLYIFLVLVVSIAEAKLPDNEPPQTILVNNMALQAVRTNLSEKNVDFTAEYQYADGDVVHVACSYMINFWRTVKLTMEYPIADTLSDKFNSTNLSSNHAIGFSTKLHSGHNNSYMICTDTKNTDYTKFMVRFVMRKEINIVSIKINGMTLQPKLINKPNNQYIIEYNYVSNLPIKVVCEVKRADVKLVVLDSGSGFVGEVNGYKKEQKIKSKLSEMSFRLSGENKELSCSSDHLNGGASAESVNIKFSMGNFLIEQYSSLQMKLPPNGTVMELYAYSDVKSRKVIFYEFEDDERLQFKCGPLHSPQAGPILYIHMKDSICEDDGCYVIQNVIVTDQHDDSEIVCRLIELYDNRPNEEKVKALKEIRVILRKRVLTTTSTTTTTTTTTTVQPTDQTNILAYSLSAVGVLMFVVLLLVYLKVQNRCCYRTRAQRPLPPLPRPDPVADGAYYENMLSVFAAINEREAEAMENHYEEIQ